MVSVDMNGEETPRRDASVSKRRRLEDQDVDSGSDGKVDFNQEDNAGVDIFFLGRLCGYSRLFFLLTGLSA